MLALAGQFQGHHKEHAELLAKTVQKLGGKPVSAKKKYSFPVDQLKTQADVLRFAAQLEQGAVSAYLGAVPLFGGITIDTKLMQAILAGDAIRARRIAKAHARRGRARASLVPLDTRRGSHQ